MGDCENCVFAAGLLVSGDGGGWKRQGVDVEVSGDREGGGSEEGLGK